MVESRIRFRIGDNVSNREKVVRAVNAALDKYIKPEWFRREHGNPDELTFSSPEHYAFFEKCLLYVLSEQGLKMKIESGIVTTKYSELPSKELQGQA